MAALVLDDGGRRNREFSRSPGSILRLFNAVLPWFSQLLPLPRAPCFQSGQWGTGGSRPAATKCHIRQGKPGCFFLFVTGAPRGCNTCRSHGLLPVDTKNKKCVYIDERQRRYGIAATLSRPIPSRRSVKKQISPPYTQTALEIARSLVVGYIEEEDDMDEETDASETEDNAGGDTDVDACQSRRRKASLSGSDSDGSVDRHISMMHWSHRSSATTPRASASSRATTPRAFTPSRAARTPRELIARLGHPTSFSGTDDNSQEPGASTKRSKAAGRDDGGSGGGGGGNSTDDSRPGRLRSTGSGSDSSENTRRRSLGRRATVGAGVKLSAEAAAILNAEIPTPGEDGDDSAGRGRSKSVPGVGDMKPTPSVPPNPRQIITRNATTPEAPVSTVPPNPRQTITRNATAPDAPLPTVDGPGLQGTPRRLTPRSSSLSSDRPLSLDRAVAPRWMEVCMCVDQLVKLEDLLLGRDRTAAG